MAQPSSNLKNPFEKGETPEPSEGDEGGGEPGGVVVSLKGGDDDEDDEDDSDEQSAAPQRETSRQRRVNRYKEQKEGRERAERELAEYKARVAYMENLHSQPRAPAGPTTSLDDQYKTEVDKIYAERQQLSADYEHLVAKGALTEGLKKSMWEKQRDLNTREARLNTRYAQLSDPSNHPGHQAMDQERNTTAQWLRMNHSDVLAHPQAQSIGMFAAAEEARLVANGAPRDFNTAEKAMQAAKLHFGLAKRPPPSPATRRAYSGGSTSANSGGGSANGSAPTHMTLTKAHQEMAEARFPDLKPSEAHKKWANGIGRKVLEARAAKRAT